MTKKEFTKKCLYRGYGTLDEINAWIKQCGKKSEFTEEDTDQLAQWCAVVSWKEYPKDKVNREVRDTYELDDKAY